jgi:hypothetical protein
MTYSQGFTHYSVYWYKQNLKPTFYIVLFINTIIFPPINYFYILNDLSFKFTIKFKTFKIDI